ncbi:MAG: amidohydrolase family protein [Proteobacteria bacterium]|nr:amidohydrolase family protein [Pseudomonadota bacterium]
METEAEAAEMLSGNGQAGCVGTVDELVAIMGAAGIQNSVLAVAVPTRAMYDTLSRKGRQGGSLREETVIAGISEHIKGRNEWACRTARTHHGLVPFIALDPIMGTQEMVAELKDKFENYGAGGIKLHPGLGHYFPDDPRLWPVYEAAASLELPVLSHGGLCAAPESYTRPRNYDKVLEAFPNLTLIVAHLGRIHFKETLALAANYPNVYFDTSSAVPGDANGEKLDHAETFLGPLQTNDEVVEVIRSIGAHRVLFGTDYPWFHPGRDLRRFSRLGFTKEESRAILGENARRILGL